MLAALMPRARVKVLALLLLRADTDHYLREVARLAGVPLRAAQRELAKLATIGLVESRRRGHQVFFTVDRGHPLFADLRSLLLKTEGIAVPLRVALSSLGGVEAAVLLGPVTEGTGRAPGALDLLVVGDPDRTALRAVVKTLEALVGRTVSYAVMSSAQFAGRRAAKDPSLERALSGQVIPVIGDINAIE